MSPTPPNRMQGYKGEPLKAELWSEDRRLVKAQKIEGREKKVYPNQ